MNKKSESLPKYATIGNRIRQIREKYRLSQTTFARKVGISQTFLSDLERGAVRPPEPLLLAIEYVYRFRREWIMTGDEPWHVEEVAPVIIPFVGVEASERQLKYWINKVIRVLESGDKEKIEALKAQLRAFDPGEKKEYEGAKERRVYPRSVLTVPVDFEIVDRPGEHAGIVINVSQLGLLIQTPHNMAVGEIVFIMVLIGKEAGDESFKTKGEIIWKEKKQVEREGGAEEYQYGVKLLEVLDEGHTKIDFLVHGYHVNQNK